MICSKHVTRVVASIITGELRQRAIIGGLALDFVPPVVTTPSFQAPSTQQVLNDSRR